MDPPDAYGSLRAPQTTGTRPLPVTTPVPVENEHVTSPIQIGVLENFALETSRVTVTIALVEPAAV